MESSQINLFVMVWFISQDGQGPVELFGKENPDQLMRKRHPGER